MEKRARFSYLTDNTELNSALNLLDNELAEMQSSISVSEEQISLLWDELNKLKERVKRIEQFLQKKFLEEWDEFRGENYGQEEG